ncbi:HEAT repeat domain-containing protein [Paludibaculum fermentans]|uniref:HEAT repeat domain-containing protein n=1 Tax=Paludibaculum fermentans TaxID=1473598 RepID=UPI003EBF168F
MSPRKRGKPQFHGLAAHSFFDGMPPNRRDRSLRARHWRRVLRAVRRARQYWPDLASAVDRKLRQGATVEAGLWDAITSPSLGHLSRGTAARILAIAKPSAAADCLLNQLWSQQEERALFETALAIEETQDARVIRPLLAALQDREPGRQLAAARALGWVDPKGNARVARVLSEVLADTSRTPAVRAEAAHSLAYQYSNRAIPSLLAALSDPDGLIRFWCVVSLGFIKNRRSWRQSDSRVVPALESMLNDTAAPDGVWTSVGREALWQLAHRNPILPDYVERLRVETERIL